MIKAMLFDLDGTLVQTERLKAISYSRAAVELCSFGSAPLGVPPLGSPRDRRDRQGGSHTFSKSDAAEAF